MLTQLSVVPHENNLHSIFFQIQNHSNVLLNVPNIIINQWFSNQLVVLKILHDSTQKIMT